MNITELDDLKTDIHDLTSKEGAYGSVLTLFLNDARATEESDRMYKKISNLFTSTKAERKEKRFKYKTTYQKYNKAAGKLRSYEIQLGYHC